MLGEVTRRRKVTGRIFHRVLLPAVVCAQGRGSLGRDGGAVESTGVSGGTPCPEGP